MATKKTAGSSKRKTGGATGEAGGEVEQEEKVVEQAESGAKNETLSNVAIKTPGEDQSTQRPKGQTKTEQPRPLDKISAVGHGVWLMTQSPLHKHLFIADLEWLLIPPISAGQFRLWRNGDQPLAIATWGFLDDFNERRMKEGKGKLSPGAWNSGHRLWLMDLIAPFGGKEEALAEIKESVFPDREIWTFNTGKDGKIFPAKL